MALLYAAEGVNAVTGIAKNVFDIDVSWNQTHPDQRPIKSLFIPSPVEPVPVTSGAVLVQPPISYTDENNPSLDGK